MMFPCGMKLQEKNDLGEKGKDPQQLAVESGVLHISQQYYLGPPNCC